MLKDNAVEGMFHMGLSLHNSSVLQHHLWKFMQSCDLSVSAVTLK